MGLDRHHNGAKVLEGQAGVGQARRPALGHRKEGRPGSPYGRPLSDPEIVHHLLVAQAGDLYRPYQLAGHLDARSRSAAGAGSSIRPRRRAGGVAPATLDHRGAPRAIRAREK
jgi:hypothetical protein